LDFGFPACGFLHSWIPDVHHRAWLIDWDGASLTFCLGWPQPTILLISASQVVGITQVWASALFFFFQYWNLNSEPPPWGTPPALFLWRVFWDRVSRIICLGWLWILILLISASWVARITGVSHCHPASALFEIRSCYAVQAGLELCRPGWSQTHRHPVFASKCWDYRQDPLCPIGFWF
jgi:hypothetical protein